MFLILVYRAEGHVLCLSSATSSWFRYDKY